MDTLFLALRVVVSLGAVLTVIWFVQRRMSRGGTLLRTRERAISIVSRQSVGAKASVAVVEVGGRRFLLGVTEHAVSVLHSEEADAAAVATVTAAAAPATAPAAAAPVAARQESAADAFAAVLAAASIPSAPGQDSAEGPHAVFAAPAAAAHPVASSALPAVQVRRAAPTPRPRATASSQLAGSILSAGTWKQAALALRQGR